MVAPIAAAAAKAAPVILNGAKMLMSSGGVRQIASAGASRFMGSKYATPLLKASNGIGRAAATPVAQAGMRGAGGMAQFARAFVKVAAEEAERLGHGKSGNSAPGDNEETEDKRAKPAEVVKAPKPGMGLGGM